MLLAVCFPGQGSQQIGMGKALGEAFAESRAVFAEIDEALGEKLSATIWDGPEEKLTLTANAQPALMAVSMAALRALEARGFSLARQAKFVAGHSLGEYSALCAAGSISISDTARLLRIRGNAMQAAVPAGAGAMAAIIGLERDEVEAACQEAAGVQVGKGRVCQIANDNGGGQLVISGSRAEVDAACEILKAKGAKRAILLPVSAPFHCALMAPAARAMTLALAAVDVRPPCVPLVANVLALPITSPDEIRTRLVEQVTGQVRWRESVEFMASAGITTQLELGSGKVLSGLVRRIARDVTAIACGTPADIDAVLSAIA